MTDASPLVRCVAHSPHCSDEMFADPVIAICAKHGFEFTKRFWKNAARLREAHVATPPSAKARGIVQPDTGVVYYLMIDNIIKIGFTTNFERRRSEYPPTAHVLATEPGDQQLEARRHRQFNKQLTNRREWFEPSAELWNHIRNLRGEQ